MLDMGGAPSSANTKSNFRLADASKNSDIQAVAFDFSVLTRSASSKRDSPSSDLPTENKVDTKVEPDRSMIEHMAKLLNVNLGGERTFQKPKEVDDLSLLTSERPKISEKEKGSVPKPIRAALDIRSKYADKLHKKGVKGGLAGVELAKSQVEDSLRQGDAAGHVHARKVVMQDEKKSSQHWIATTGTGRLLQYLTRRSLQIGLLPTPGTSSDEFKQQREQMLDLRRQLKDVVLDVVPDDVPENPTAASWVEEMLGQLGSRSPDATLLVSDREDYLRAAKDAGLVTCRVRPPNAPRGNVSTHYTIPSVTDVEDVLNEANGISFNAVVNR